MYKLVASAESMSEHPLGKAITLSYLESNLGQTIKPEEFKMVLYGLKSMKKRF